MDKQIADMDVSFRAGEIRGPTGTVSIDPKPMAVLEYLATHLGDFCSRDALMESAWPGRVVSDATLTSTISLLRRAIRDAGIRGIHIETRSKRGYRLQADTPDGADTPFNMTGRRVRQSMVVALAGILLMTLAVAIVRMASDSPATSVRLDYEFETPDGTRYSPTIIVQAGTTGAVGLDDSLTMLQVRVLEIRSDRVRLNTQLNSGNTHLGLLQTLPFESQSRITLPRSPDSDAPHRINVRATPSEKQLD